MEMISAFMRRTVPCAAVERPHRTLHAMPRPKRLRIAVIGHAEHVTIARVLALPRPGEILHLDEPFVIAGGGGGIAFHQLANGPAEVHFFTAVGRDDAGAFVRDALDATGARIHAAQREAPHTRDVVLVTPDGERTIIVVGKPLHPLRSDALPWDLLASCDAAYFTGEDPETLVAARAARLLVVTARRGEVLARSGVRADVVVGSARDPREYATLADYRVPPLALVMTHGAAGGRVETTDGVLIFNAAPSPLPIIGSYGAGDTFAGALTWYLRHQSL
jgi:ribokinase